MRCACIDRKTQGVCLRQLKALSVGVTNTYGPGAGSPASFFSLTIQEQVGSLRQGQCGWGGSNFLISLYLVFTHSSSLWSIAVDGLAHIPPAQGAVLALPLPVCVTSGKFVNVSMPHSPYL